MREVWADMEVEALNHLHHRPVGFSCRFRQNTPLISAVNPSSPASIYLCAYNGSPASLLIWQLLSHSISRLHPRARETDWLQTGCDRQSAPFLWKQPVLLPDHMDEVIAWAASPVLIAGVGCAVMPVWLWQNSLSCCCYPLFLLRKGQIKTWNLGFRCWIKMIITGCMEPLIHRGKAFESNLLLLVCLWCITVPIFALIFSRTVVEVSSKQFVATATIFHFLGVRELKVLSWETEWDSCESSYPSLHRQHPKLRQSAKWRGADTRGRQLTWINHIDLGFASLCSSPSLSFSLSRTHARVRMYPIKSYVLPPNFTHWHYYFFGCVFLVSNMLMKPAMP